MDNKFEGPEGEFPPKVQAEIQRRISDAQRDAKLIIANNGLLMAFSIRDLTDSVQKNKAEALELLIQRQLLVDSLGNKLSSDAGTAVLGALSFVRQRVEYCVSHPAEYPGAGNIRFAMDKLFEMVHEKTGKPIDPQRPIDSRVGRRSEKILPRWREMFT